MNNVILAGRLGQDPELRYTGSGTAVTNLRMATDESYTNNDGDRIERTEWHNVVVWGRQAELVNEYKSSGDFVMVRGSLQTRSWEDRDGETRYTTEVKAQNIEFGPRGEMDESDPRQTATAASGAEESDFEPEDELPF